MGNKVRPYEYDIIIVCSIEFLKSFLAVLDLGESN